MSDRSLRLIGDDSSAIIRREKKTALSYSTRPKRSLLNSHFGREDSHFVLYFVLMSKSVTQRIAKQQPDLLLFDGQDCVSALKALGEDNRVRIIGLLMDGPLGVCEIARRLDY